MITPRIRNSAMLTTVLLAGMTIAFDSQAQSMFNHQIPIKVPKGTNGMQPELALVYDPGSGNGIVGVGWQLTGISAITRVRYRHTIDYAGDDDYAHSQLGILIRQSDGSYRSKQESFTKLVPSGQCGDGPCSWTAYDRSGTKYEYGTTDHSTMLCQSGHCQTGTSVRVWGLSKVVDLFGNYYEVTYFYTPDPDPADWGVFYPISITYTKGPGAGSAFRTVEFSYEGRSDYDSGIIDGGYQAFSRRLKWIRVKSAGSLLHAYRLFYGHSGAVTGALVDNPVYSPSSGRSRLTAVQEYGSDEATVMPAQTFGWQESGTGFAQANWAVPNTWNQYGYVFTGDFNGDGKTDTATPVGQNLYVNLSTGNGFSPQVWHFSGPFGALSNTWTGDFNGDGKTDIATRIGGNVYMYLSTGSGLIEQTWTVPDIWNQSGYVFTGDFNGDGKTDVATPVGQVLHVYLSTGSGFDHQEWPFNGQYGALSNTWTGDFNGDGRTDIATAIGGNVYMYLSTGSGLVNPTPIWTVPNVWNQYGYVWTGDFNGDGKTDIATAVGQDLYVNLSTGTKFLPATWHINGPFGDLGYTRLGDFNGDGRTDIASASSGNVYVYLSTGYSLDLHTWTVDNNWGAVSNTWTGDFDGNGRTDIVSANGANIHMNLTNSPFGDLMTSVNNGLGGTVTVEYTPATQVPNAIAPTSSGSGIPNTSPRPLVTKVTTTDGRTNPFTGVIGRYSTHYNYYNGRSLPGTIPNRRDLGFAYIETVDDQTGQYTRTYYNQNPGYEGHVSQIDSYAANGQLVSRTLRCQNGCSLIAPNPGTELVLETEEEIQTYEFGTFAFKQKTTKTFDAYGNATVVSQDADGLANVTVTTTFTNDTTNWILGRITEVKTTSGSTTLGWMKNVWTGNTITTKSEWLDTTGAWIDTIIGYDTTTGNQTTVTEPALGDGITRTTSTTYDSTFHAYPASVTNALGHVTQKTYNGDGLVTSFTDANGNVTSTNYDVFGRKQTEAGPDGGVTTYSYLDYGNVNSQRNGVSSTVDTRGLWKDEYFDGSGFTYLTNSSSDCTEGYASVEHQKDDKGRPYRTSQPHCPSDAAVWTTAAFDAAGRMSSTTPPDGRSSTYTYGTNYTRVTDPNGKVTTKYFNARKKVTSIVDAAGQTTTYGYDPLGRLTSVTLPNNAITSFTYDTLNRKHSVTDPQMGSRTVTFLYDGLNRVYRKQPAGGQAIVYTYDESSFANYKGRLTTVVDGGGRTTHFNFTYTRTDGRAGRIETVAKQIDGNSFTLSSTYDKGGRLIHLDYPDGSYVDYTYSNGGNLQNVSLNGTVLATWSNYSATGKPRNVAYGNGVATAYGYDVMDHLLNLTTAKGASTFQNLSYDWYVDSATGTPIPNTNGVNIGKIWDNRSNKVAADGANTDESQAYTYDDLYRLTAATGAWGSKNYVYDSVGNPTTFQGQVNRTLNFNGTQVTSGTGLSNVTYDFAGNMTHKVLDGAAWDYAWDENGNLASVAKDGVFATQMFYDADGQRVKKVYTPSTGPTVTTTYVGKMYEKRAYSDSTPERHTVYVFANGQLIAQATRSGPIATAFNRANRWRTEMAAATLYNGNDVVGAAKKAYHYLSAAALHPQAVKAVVLGFFALFASGVLAAFLASLHGKRRRLSGFSPALRLASLSVVLIFAFSACSGGSGGTGFSQSEDYLIGGDTTQGPAIGTYYYHRNHINSSSVVTDVGGNEVTRILYLPFGEVAKANSSGTDTVTSKFTGQELDEESGLYNYGARYYDPAIGRFVSADSVVPDVKDAQSFNRYSYVRNNPIMYVDPTGHFLDFIGDFFNAVFNGIRAFANAVASAACWLANAVADIAKFVARAAVYAFDTIVGIVTNPLALANLVAGAILTLVLAPAGIAMWAKAMAVSIAATSLAQAAGVSNPLVLGLIGAMAGAFGAGATKFTEYLKTACGWAASQGLAAVEGDRISGYLSLVNGLGSSMLVNAATDRANSGNNSNERTQWGFIVSGDGRIVPIDPTYSLGLSFNVTLPFGLSLTGSAGLVFDDSWNFGYYLESGGGAAIGAGATSGLQLQITNAPAICDLSGPFTNVSAGGGWGLGATADAVFGFARNGSRIYGGGFTFGPSIGATSFVGITTTNIMPLRGPLCN